MNSLQVYSLHLTNDHADSINESDKGHLQGRWVSQNPIMNALLKIVFIVLNALGLISLVRDFDSDTTQNVETDQDDTEASELRIKFQANYALIMQLSPADIEKLKVEGGKLVLAPTQTTPKDQAQAIALIQQTYRQTCGRLIDAHYGNVLYVEAMQQINTL